MKKIIVLITSISFLIASCATVKNMNNQQKGAAIGVASGAALGAAVSKGSIWGILLGAAVGGLAGNFIGQKMDIQARELKQAVPTAEVQRVGEGINVTFNSGLMFEINKAEISASYQDDLAAAAIVFNKHAETNIVIEGHTDDSGSDNYNMTLSEKRASAVVNFLVSHGINRNRLTEKWYGESQPKFPNDSDENRQKNRRVEVAIVANENMKTEANTKSN